MKLIQFIGTQRSGSNLLRTMLNQLPEIAAPHPPHILQTFEPLLPFYGDLKDTSRFESLVNDVCLWVELNPVKWQIPKLNREQIRSRCKENTLIALFYEIYAHYASSYGCEFACCKSMSNAHRYRDLNEAGLAPWYIYLHRDGRDVACSFKKTIVGEKHVYHIAKQWKNDQERSLEIEQNTPSDRIIRVKYLDLITEPESILRELCAFLNLPFNYKMLNYFNSEESLNTASSGTMWKNLIQPIMTDNFNKYLKELTQKEIRIFESVAGETLEKLGYKCSFTFKNGTEFDKQTIKVFSLENERMKKEAVLRAHQRDIGARYPPEVLLNRLRERMHIR